MKSQPASATPLEPAGLTERDAPSLYPSAPPMTEKTGASPNGHPTPSRLPKARRFGTAAKLALFAGLFIVLGIGGWASYRYIFAGDAIRADLVLHKVRRERLLVTIVERGALESAENNDITCKVKARTQGSTTASTIKWVIDDGSRVKNGEKVIELDESGFEEQKKTQQIVVDGAESNMIQAQKALEITKSQNESDIAAAINALELAKIDLDKYQKGDYPQNLSDVEGRAKVAESDVEQQRDRAAWAKRMVKLGYMTASQADSEQSRLQSLELGLKKVHEERRVLTDPIYGVKKRT